MLVQIPKSSAAIPAETHVELVRSLFGTRLPPLAMSALFLMVGGLAYWETRDAGLLALLIVGTVTGGARLAVLFRGRETFDRATVSPARAIAIERRYALCYFLFAASLGALGGQAFVLPSPDVHMAVAVLLMGYSAGVVSGVAYRPWISIPSLVLAVGPLCAIGLVSGNALYAATAVAILGFLLAGARAIMQRYRSEMTNTTRRLSFSKLARQDHLTQLPNRLALTEYFAGIGSTGKVSGKLAIHCLDLDDFKPVNDIHGHAAGDALLVEVAERLRDLTGEQDIAVRTGGDEFVLVQAGVGRRDEADAMAERIEHALSQPYVMDGRPVAIGVSIGTAIARRGIAPGRLIELADGALMERKSARKMRAPSTGHRVRPRGSGARRAARVGA